MRKAENMGLTTREPKKTLQAMLNDIGDSMRKFATSNDEEDAEDEYDEHTELGKMIKDDKPGRVMGTIFKMVQQHPDNVSAEADEDRRNDTTWMGRCS